MCGNGRTRGNVAICAHQDIINCDITAKAFIAAVKLKEDLKRQIACRRFTVLIKTVVFVLPVALIVSQVSCIRCEI